MKKIALTFLAVSCCQWLLAHHPQTIIRILGTSDQELVSEVRNRILFSLDYFGIETKAIIMVNFTEFDKNFRKEEGEIQATIVPTEYEDHFLLQIFINKKLTEKQKLSVLMHEMVHVKQYIKKELIEKSDYCFIWKGFEYEDVRNISYHDREWETEAMNLMNKLAKAYHFHIQALADLKQKTAELATFKLRVEEIKSNLPALPLLQKQRSPSDL